MKRILEVAWVALVTIGWWGLVYPQLSLTPQTCVQEEYMQEEYVQEKLLEGMSAQEIMELCAVEQKPVRIRSRLYEYLCKKED